MPEDAQAQFDSHIAQNPYPGRGLLLGHGDDGNLLLVYWIMGRSDHSRNRRFIASDTTLRTEPVDASMVKDPSLIIYEAMLELEGQQLVSNGDQTRTLYAGLQSGKTFEQALREREREPDAPNYTPRISGLIDLRAAAPQLFLSVIKSCQFDPSRSQRTTFEFALPPKGLAVGLTTYMGDGSPLPSYRGEPLVLPCDGSPSEVLMRYYEALDADNRIAVAVKQIDPAGRCLQLLVHNRYDA